MTNKVYIVQLSFCAAFFWWCNDWNVEICRGIQEHDMTKAVYVIDCKVEGCWTKSTMLSSPLIYCHSQSLPKSVEKYIVLVQFQIMYSALSFTTVTVVHQTILLFETKPTYMAGKSKLNSQVFGFYTRNIDICGEVSRNQTQETTIT